MSCVNDAHRPSGLHDAALLVLQRAATSLAANGDWRAALADVLSVCMDAVPLSGALIATPTGPDGGLEILAAAGAVDTLAGHVLTDVTDTFATGRARIVHAPAPPSAFAAMSLRAEPLEADQHRLGVLLLATGEHDLGDGGWPTFAGTLATQIAHVLALAGKLAQAAERDLGDHHALTTMNAAVLWMEGDRVVGHRGDLRALVGDFVGAIDLATLFLTRKGGDATGRTGKRLVLRRLEGGRALLVREVRDTGGANNAVERAMVALAAILPAIGVVGPPQWGSPIEVTGRHGEAMGGFVGYAKALATSAALAPGALYTVEPGWFLLTGPAPLPPVTQAVWLAHGARLDPAAHPGTWTLRLPLTQI